MVTFKKLILDSWFPTVIGIVDCPFFNLNKNTNITLNKHLFSYFYLK